MVSSVALPFLLRYSELIPSQDTPDLGSSQLDSAMREHVGMTKKTAVRQETTDDD
jgi:hypothetical protein